MKKGEWRELKIGDHIIWRSHDLNHPSKDDAIVTKITDTCAIAVGNGLELEISDETAHMYHKRTDTSVVSFPTEHSPYYTDIIDLLDLTNYENDAKDTACLIERYFSSGKITDEERKDLLEYVDTTVERISS